MATGKRILALALLASGLALPANGQAAAISFVLHRSDRLADGSGYLQVTIADSADGAIDFTVEPLSPLLDRSSDRFEIRAFALNVDPDLQVAASNVTGLPEHWSARATSRMDGFGRFNLTLIGVGPEQHRSLQFSIVGVEGDSPASYVFPSSGTAREGSSLFAARVRGLLGETACSPNRKCAPRAIPTAFIGAEFGAEPVPLPAAGWVAFPAVLAALRYARRRRR